MEGLKTRLWLSGANVRITNRRHDPVWNFFDNCFPEMSAHPQFARVISLQAQNLSLLLNENTCILVIFKAKDFLIRTS